MRTAAISLIGLLCAARTLPAAGGHQLGPDSEPEKSVPQGRIEFNHHIRPILSGNCLKCHGPDAAERKAGLRLDVREVALAATDGDQRVIVPGKPEESALVARIFSASERKLMPPRKSGKQLSEREKQLLRLWIEQGAEYQPHWSFAAPSRPPLPVVRAGSWPRNPVDRFILARLEAEGLGPSPEAPKTTLIRRLSFDLTGLPPAPADVDRFLAEGSPGGFESVVERFLASPSFGERLAIEWLDAARFADTHGYHIDSGRDMTRWRDWVIGAFNRNLPFDRFTIEQVAGDLLPGATQEQKIASGFHRNHMINFEGGAIPEEYHTAYIVDRVNTTATVWLGLTVACTQCHDHKYDPLTQKEFYQLYAFFNNVPENGLDGQKGNAAPLLRIPSAEQSEALARLEREVRALEAKLAGPLPEVDAAQAAWEAQALLAGGTEWAPLDPVELISKGGATLSRLDDGAILAGGANPASDVYTVTARTDLPALTAVRLEALPDPSLASGGPGRSENGNLVLTEVRLEVAGRSGGAPEGAPGRPVKLSAASADFSQQDFPVEKAIDGDPRSGWAIHPQVGKAHAAVFEAESPVAAEGGALVTVTLEFQSPFARHQAGRFRLSATSSRDPHGKQALPEEVRKALAAAPPGSRSDEDRAKLRAHYRARVSAEGKALHEELARLKKEYRDLDASIPTSMVMSEMPEPRDTFLLVRGQYDKKGEKVLPGVPAVLPPLPAGAPANRLGLARWLVDRSHPLTARVTVNRYWQLLFGTGLVRTAEDFGAQGEAPSHPELLDWLAVEFVESGWDVKRLIRLLVESAAYRQDSAVAPGLLERDPENRLLARGPRFRLQAEFIRDQALAASGLLDPRIGGASVSPYQPPGLWEELASREDGKNWTAQTYVQSHGPDLYRRTLYTFWKRTSPPPTLLTFDAPDRETCTVRRPRTNTPLQALILLNDPTYVEAARKLAERMMKEGGPTPRERLAFAFKLLTARRPTPAEGEVLAQALAAARERYRADEGMALKLLAAGESPRDASLDPRELAAFTVVASMILNLDETLTKG